MDADRPPNPDRHERAPATLGDLLYADTAEAIASETGCTCVLITFTLDEI